MICIFTQENAGIHVAVLYFVYPPLKLFPMCNFLFYSNLVDQYPGNCPPLSPLSQHFALSEKQVAGGGGEGAYDTILFRPFFSRTVRTQSNNFWEIYLIFVHKN